MRFVNGVLTIKTRRGYEPLDDEEDIDDEYENEEIEETVKRYLINDEGVTDIN